MLDVCTEAVSPVPADGGVDPIPPQARTALSLCLKLYSEQLLGPGADFCPHEGSVGSSMAADGPFAGRLASERQLGAA